MKLWAESVRAGFSGWLGRSSALLVGAFLAVVLTGCGKLPGVGMLQVKAKTAEDNVELCPTDREALVGKNADVVVKVLGKPKGIFERRDGKVWMYSRWCVEFNARGEVVRLERDIAATGSGGDGPSPSMALAAKSVPRS